MGSKDQTSNKNHQEHDRRYQDLFRNVDIVRDLLVYCVDASWLSLVDLNAIELLNTKSLTGQLVRRDADVIYKLPFLDGNLCYLALFLEFQSRPDPFMALRISTYKHLFWENCVKMKQLSPNGKLPPVFGLVLYNGRRRWNCPKQLRSLIELPKQSTLWEHQPNARYHLIDEARINAHHQDSISHQLFKIEFCREPEEMANLVKRVATLVKGTPDHTRLWNHVGRWLSAATFSHLQYELPLHEFIDDLEGAETMLSHTFETWKEQWKQEGLQEGREEGREQGIEESRYSSARVLIREGVNDDIIMRATGLSQEVIEQIKKQIG